MVTFLPQLKSAPAGSVVNELLWLYDLVAFYVVPPEWSISEDEVFAKKMSLSVS